MQANGMKKDRGINKIIYCIIYNSMQSEIHSARMLIVYFMTQIILYAILH